MITYSRHYDTLAAFSRQNDAGSSTSTTYYLENLLYSWSFSSQNLKVSKIKQFGPLGGACKLLSLPMPSLLNYCVASSPVYVSFCLHQYNTNSLISFASTAQCNNCKYQTLRHCSLHVHSTWTGYSQMEKRGRRIERGGSWGSHPVHTERDRIFGKPFTYCGDERRFARKIRMFFKRRF